MSVYCHGQEAMVYLYGDVSLQSDKVMQLIIHDFMLSTGVQ